VLTKPCEPQQIIATVEAVLTESGDSPVAEPLTQFDRNHLRLITDKLVANANALEVANHRLSALTELTLQLASERDPRVVIDTFCHGVRRLFAARCAIAVVVDDSVHGGVRIATSGIPMDEAAAWPALDTTSGVGRTLMQDQKPLRLAQEALLASWPQLAHTVGASRCGLLVPISSLHQAFGWLLLLDEPQGPEFTTADERALAIQAAQVGRIHENGSLVVRVRQQLEQLRTQAVEREREATVLKLEHAVTQALAAASSVASGVRTVIQIVCESQLWQFGRFWRVDNKTQRLHLFAQWQDPGVALDILDNGQPVQRTLGLGEGLAGRVWQSGKPMWESQLASGLAPDANGPAHPLRAASGSIFPVISEGSTIGVLSLLSLETRAPDVRLTASGMVVCHQLGQFLRRKDAETALRDSEQFTQLTLDSLLEHIGVLDTSGVLLAVNHAWRMFTQGDGEPLLRARVGANYLEVCETPRVPPSPEACAFAAGVRGVIQAERDMFSMEYACQSAGATYWFQARVTRFAQSDTPRVVVSHEDITERRFVEERVRRLHRVATVLGDINALIVRVQNRDYLFEEACRIAVDTGRFNKACVAVLNQETRAARIAAAVDSRGESGYFAQFERLLKGWVTDGHTAFDEVVTGGRPVVVNDISSARWMRSADAALGSGARALACLPLVHAGQTVGALILFASERNYFDAQEVRLLTQLANDMSFALDFIGQAERLNHLAYYDALTGLANTRLFNDRLSQELASGALYAHKVVLAFIDLDRFKTVNDSLGRMTGDNLLKQMAGRISQFNAGPVQVARVGADHFTLVLLDAGTDLHVARTINDLHAHCFDAPFRMADTELRISGRIGVAVFPNDGTDAETLFRNAESAAARARKSADKVLFYAPRMTDSVTERMALESELRAALQKEQFVLHYQPKVTTRTRRIEGLEALIRWRHPERGLVPPMTFIPLMEETGLIIEVGAWALQQAARDVGRWRALGLQAPNVAVNVSTIQLRRPGFVEMVAGIVGSDAADAGIDIEITESAIMENIDHIVDHLHALRTLGVHIAIDDFGTGYSSLAYLSKLPVQILKIDRAFVMTMNSNPANLTLVATMVSLAHALQLKTVAEGVETDEEAQALARLQCDQIQGYLVSRPLAFDAMSEFLRTHAHGDADSPGETADDAPTAQGP
jgi:diguanylate cyclase (GGDEF)-like protein